MHSSEFAPHVRRSEKIVEHVRTPMAQQICGDLLDKGQRAAPRRDPPFCCFVSTLTEVLLRLQRIRPSVDSFVAMTRYFFHLRRGDILIEDTEGDVFESLEAALAEAKMAATELLINSIRTGQPIDGDAVEIWSPTTRVGQAWLIDMLPTALRPDRR